MNAFRFVAFSGAVSCCIFTSGTMARAAAPVLIETLTAAQLQALPASTEVIFDGRTVTLGVLRDEHTKRMARLHAGASLGQAAALKQQSLVSPGNLVGTAPKIAGKSAFAPTMQLHDPSGQNALWALDYEQFCNAAGASLCLYLPSDAKLKLPVSTDSIPSSNILLDKDPLITDSTTCKSGGGHYSPGVCIYEYPMTQHVEFEPAKLVSVKGSCSDASLTFVNDSHGAAELKTASAPRITTGSNASTCLATVVVAK